MTNTVEKINDILSSNHMKGTRCESYTYEDGSRVRSFTRKLSDEEIAFIKADPEYSDDVELKNIRKLTGIDGKETWCLVTKEVTPRRVVDTDTIPMPPPDEVTKISQEHAKAASEWFRCDIVSQLQDPLGDAEKKVLRDCFHEFIATVQRYYPDDDNAAVAVAISLTDTVEQKLIGLKQERMAELISRLESYKE